MRLFLSGESILEISIWKPLLPFVNLDDLISFSPSEGMAEEK